MLAGKSFAHRLPRLRVTTPMLAVVVALFLVSTGNNSFWSATASAAEISWRENFRFAVAIFVMLVAAFTLVIAPFGFRFLFKPVISGLLILAAVNSYFMDTYGVVIDAGMLRNTIETDPSEVDGLLSPVLFWHVLGAGVLPALVVYWLPVRYATFPKQLGRQLLTMTLALGVVGAALYSHYKEFSLVGRENRSLRYLINPTYSIYAAGKLLAAELSAGEVALRPLGRDAYQPPDRSPDGKPRLVVFVLGETVRAHNATFEGYERKTMPLMAQEEIVSFDSVYSCGTATAVSLPCMFSRQNRSSYDEFASDNRENLLDVLKHAGIRVLWRENNSGCKGVCARVKTQNTTQMTVPTYCNTDGCFDEILLYQLDKWLSESQGDTFVVLHQQGNHGPEYYKRYPPEFRKFRPECRSNRPQDCSRQDLINAYDNAILYTDFVLSQAAIPDEDRLLVACEYRNRCGVIDLAQDPPGPFQSLVNGDVPEGARLAGALDVRWSPTTQTLWFESDANIFSAPVEDGVVAPPASVAAFGAGENLHAYDIDDANERLGYVSWSGGGSQLRVRSTDPLDAAPDVELAQTPTDAWPIEQVWMLEDLDAEPVRPGVRRRQRAVLHHRPGARGRGDVHRHQRAVVARQAEEIALLVTTSLRRLGLTDGQPEVVLGGGMLTSGESLLVDPVIDAILAVAPGAQITIVSDAPIYGSALLGLEALWASDLSLTDEERDSRRTRLRESLRTSERKLT